MVFTWLKYAEPRKWDGRSMDVALFPYVIEERLTKSSSTLRKSNNYTY